MQKGNSKHRAVGQPAVMGAKLVFCPGMDMWVPSTQTACQVAYGWTDVPHVILLSSNMVNCDGRPLLII